ncbi:hypothetical protein Dsin_023034 [Dipteronia sinensis]|uniref:RNase H type-1 domain-containing protein n=1 Tax=Dipteronia sinensis TaxID=43782 RepID=A0AAE0A3M3_9ROSI|nr:hypothetical protein Dsin_023034 [Dipteronia sinensis]
MVKFRTAWWFKYTGRGTNIPITSMILNLKDLCAEPYKVHKTSCEFWVHLPVGALKFNIDGSTRGKPRTVVIRGVLRDCRGQVLGIFSSYVGLQDSNTTKILAIHKACMLCAAKANFNHKNIIIVSDSKVAVS